jgi:hypothetical protein
MSVSACGHPEARRLWPALVCYGGAAIVILAGAYFDTSTCLWRQLTGWRCPGCGMMHAFAALACGNWRAAWSYNPASFAVAPLLAWNGLQKLKGARR